MKTVLSFDDVLLEPKGSDINSRKEIDLSSKLDDRRYFDKLYNSFELDFRLPIISSPMDTVTQHEMATAIHKNGGFGIIHRYNTIREQTNQFFHVCYNNAICGAAIGVKGDFKERAQELYKAGCRVFCIDVAHGFHQLVRNAIEYLRNAFGDNIHIMAGNVATPQACECLANWGANSVRIGLGGGSVCSTRTMTGHGMPTWQSVYDCAHNWTTSQGKKVIKIADGGIKNSGDIVKALAAGADFVMLGSLLAGTDESPGKLYSENGDFAYKEYRGMASPEAQQDWNGDVNSREGISTLISYKGSVVDVLKDLENGIRSGLSYSGARTIKELQSICEFVVQTSSGRIESGTHILDTNRRTYGQKRQKKEI